MQNPFTSNSIRSAVPAGLIAFLCALFPASTLLGDDWPRSHEVRLANGRAVEYSIHVDRNSLIDSVRVRDGLIALTSSGVLLRFELPGVRLVRERIELDEVTCIGLGERGAVLAGLADGRVCRVDPATLALTDMVKLPAPVQWLGWCRGAGNRPAGLVVATRQTKAMEQDGHRWKRPCWMVHELATNKSFALDYVANTVLFDRAGRLWIGTDNGEWGGHVTRIDLSTGAVTTIKPPADHKLEEQPFWDGIYGFVELRDGQIWAFGGTSHMGVNEGQITRVDEGEARTLVAFHPPVNPVEPVPDPSRPGMPITHIIEESNGLLIFSYSDVFRVDKALKAWKRSATLEIQYHWGRPDAMGSYPAVRTVHPPSHEGEPYLLATIGDGYVVLDAQKMTPHSIPGQLATSNIDNIANTSEGTLVFEDDPALPTWKLGPKGWETPTLAPPFERDRPGDAPLPEIENDDKIGHETSVLVGPGGMIYTVSGTSDSPGTRTTAHRVDGKTVRLGRETSSLEPSSSFITADGTLWNAAHYGLLRFQKGRWEPVEALAPGDFPPGPIKPLNHDGPPWILLDHRRKRLWRLDHGTRGENPRLTRVHLENERRTPTINDGIPWSDGSLLLATDQGLRAYAPGMHTLTPANVPEPPQHATAVARDGLGRIWLVADKKLWLSEPGAKAPEAFDRVPWVGLSAVEALVADPQQPDGIIAALGSRGVAFVKANRVISASVPSRSPVP
jgi:hypothetical protein